MDRRTCIPPGSDLIVMRVWGSPLDWQEVSRAARFQAVIFDMDGTLTVPTIDFRRLREELGLPSGDLVDEIERLPPECRTRAWRVVERYEEEALARLAPQPGCVELLRRCRAAGLRIGIVTRNTGRSVEAFSRRTGFVFDGVVTRDFRPVKPHPAPVLYLLDQWRIEPTKALVVGDYVHDIESGHAAGAWTCWFENPGAGPPPKQADFHVRSMRGLEDLLFGEKPVAGDIVWSAASKSRIDPSAPAQKNHQR